MTTDSKVIAVLRVLSNIADKFDKNGLDEARPEWSHLRKKPLDPTKVVLLSGRGGGELLTLQDCFDAREALQTFNQPCPICHGSGEVETGIGMYPCQDCDGSGKIQ